MHENLFILLQIHAIIFTLCLKTVKQAPKKTNTLPSELVILETQKEGNFPFGDTIIQEEMQMKKFVALVLVLALALTCFAGCSSSSSSSQAGSSSAASGGSDSGKQLSGKVVYWSMYNEGEPEAMAIQKAAEMFMADYPDCEVEIQWTGRSNQELVGPALEGGEQIDILDNFSYSTSTDRYLDITDMMQSPALGQEDMTVEESLLPVLNQANAQGQEAAGLATDKYYGVQIAPWVVGFFYNKDLFAQAGVTDTPTTWTEFMEVCEKLKAQGIVDIKKRRLYVLDRAALADMASLEVSS